MPNTSKISRHWTSARKRDKVSFIQTPLAIYVYTYVPGRNACRCDILSSGNLFLALAVIQLCWCNCSPLHLLEGNNRTAGSHIHLYTHSVCQNLHVHIMLNLRTTNPENGENWAMITIVQTEAWCVSEYKNKTLWHGDCSMHWWQDRQMAHWGS